MRASDGVVKVADFGLARLLRGEGPASTTTSAGTLLGTVDYIEQSESASDIAARIKGVRELENHLDVIEVGRRKKA